MKIAQSPKFRAITCSLTALTLIVGSVSFPTTSFAAGAKKKASATETGEFRMESRNAKEILAESLGTTKAEINKFIKQEIRKSTDVEAGKATWTELFLLATASTRPGATATEISNSRLIAEMISSYIELKNSRPGELALDGNVLREAAKNWPEAKRKQLGIVLRKASAIARDNAAGTPAQALEKAIEKGLQDARLPVEFAKEFRMLAKAERSYAEVFDVPGEIVVEGAQGAINESFTAYFAREGATLQSKPTHKILARAKDANGGELQLVRVNYADGNAIPYNLGDVQLLLHTNPKLANSLGFYRAPGSVDLVWVPNEGALNTRLQKLAKDAGYDAPVYSMGWEPVGYPGANREILGAVDYMKLLSNGKNPMARSAIGAIHDGMHAVMLSVLNSTPNGRKVLQAFQSRAAAFLRIHERLSSEIPSGSGLSKSQIISRYESELANLLNMPFERNMAVSHYLMGYDAYFFYQTGTRPSTFFSSNETKAPMSVSRGDLKNKIEIVFENFQVGESGGNLLTRTPENNTQRIVDSLVNSIGNQDKAQVARKIFEEELGKVTLTTPEIREAAAEEVMNSMPESFFAQ